MFHLLCLAASMADYRIASYWRIDAEAPLVMRTLADPECRVRWWPGVELSILSDPCDPPCDMVALLDGGSRGIARLAVAEIGNATSIHQEWRFTTTRWWMNITAPVARWLFVRRCRMTMRQGAQGLAHHLGASLLEERTAELPPLHTGTTPRFDTAAAVGAGCAAGITSTFLQMAMWLLLSYPMWEMLLRDSRLAAAIVLGRSVLPPPASFDLVVMLTASVLHFVLSAAYGTVIAVSINRLNMIKAVCLGAVAGLLLFMINMWGFTVLFPWFAASRDTATAIAHIGFGITAAACYRYAQPLGITSHSARLMTHFIHDLP